LYGQLLKITEILIQLLWARDIYLSKALSCSKEFHFLFFNDPNTQRGAGRQEGKGELQHTGVRAPKSHLMLYHNVR
jgi:hypothetical protein